jgi:SAM-dependent methyltransferase
VNDPREIVRAGYDTIADRFAEWAGSFETPVMKWVERLGDRVPAGARVLELGCGGDNRATGVLVARYDYLGVDLSGEQLARARRAHTHANFMEADVTRLELEAESFDAVASLFMFGHIPRAEQEPLLQRIHGWLRPGGWFLTTMGTADARDEIDEDWLGAPMFFASFEETTNKEMLERTGFAIEEARVVPFEEPGHGLVRFMWVLARRPK